MAQRRFEVADKLTAQNYNHEWFAKSALEADFRLTAEQRQPQTEKYEDVVSAYCKEVRQLGFRLLEAISESLSLEKDYIGKVMGDQGQHMAVNYYPPCPQPELTFGLPSHTDPNTITILLQDGQVAGLQVLKEGKWLAVDPCPNALIVNLGDQIQAVSNGMYRSVRHRAVVNSNQERISVAAFLCPANDATIGPAKQLVTGESPALCRDFTYDEYYKKFWSRNLDEEHCLELFKG
ncbi:Flavanone 3-dioxygenase 2 [Asimina triloba]